MMRIASVRNLIRSNTRATLRARPSFVPRSASFSSAADENGRQNEEHHFRRPDRLLFFGLVISTAVISLLPSVLCEEKEEEDLPIFTRAEVAKHKTKETGVWVIFKDGVYDITEFIAGHPGGLEKIMLAAGSNIDPFWRMYQQHNVQHIKEMLEQYRIGTLDASEVIPDAVFNKDDPYAHDPERLPILKVNAAKPFNAEAPLFLLSDNLLTPSDIFFVRNHMPVPVVDPKEYVLVIQGEGISTPIRLTLEDLKKYPKNQVVSVIQCAGNRRSEYNEVKPVKGLNWAAGAISNAEWAGVYLKDILKDHNIDQHNVNIKHVQFEGLDHDITNTHYGGSVPVDTFRQNNVLLAYEMNGDELPRDHGFPIRAVVPGVVGARNVKWLSSITLSKEESKAFWQQYDYKGFSPSVDWDNVDYNSAPAITELPIQAAICEPKPGDRVSQDTVKVKGYAHSGGGKGVIRVDVSGDGGKTWKVANLKKVDQERGKEYSWALWETELDLPKTNGNVEIVCKATDSSYNTQPDTAAPIWNIRGVLNNSWHRVNVKVDEE